MDQQDNQLEQGATPENNNQENHDMASLLEQEGTGIDFPTTGEIRSGVIASLSPGQILVSVGTKSEGVITGKEYEQIPQEELDALKVGQEIPVYVLNPEDSNGNLVLSYMRAREERSWEEAETLKASRASYHSRIIGYNKGGLIVPVGGLRGFVPASQVSLSRRANLQGDTPEQRFGRMVNQEIDVLVIEVDRERRRLILSERQASPETRETLKERVIDDLHEGDVRTGRVTSLAEFGAFVNISGADGLVHLSEISWERINHPGDLLKVGQEVKVRVISIDRDKKRIGLSIRQLQEDPWTQQISKYQVGMLVEGTITRLTKFGAFARLQGDVEGLIHISEVSERRIEHPKEVLKEGDVVTLRIIKIDPENHRIGLSLRKVESMAYADMDWQSLLDEQNEQAEEVQAPQVEEEPAPMAEEVPASQVEQEPAPKVKKVRAPKAKVVPAPQAEEVPAPQAEEEPAPQVEEVPAPQAEEEPAPQVEEESGEEPK
jgi:small subunit ribosomal protein S1